MNNLTNQYQNYRNQLSGLTDVSSQLETIKNNIVAEHVQDWEDIKDKWDKATQIGTEASNVLGMFRLGQKFKAGLKSKADELKGKFDDAVGDLKGKGQDFIDSAQEQVDNVVSVAKDKADGLVSEATDAMDKAKGTMADLTGAGQEAVESGRASLGDLQNMADESSGWVGRLMNQGDVAMDDVSAPTAKELEDFPAIETEMTPMSSQSTGLSMGDLAKQFPAETIQRPSAAGGGEFQLGFTGNERSLLRGAQVEADVRGTLPQRLPASGESSGYSHSQPEEAPTTAEELSADVGDVREKTLGLWGRLKSGLFSGKAPIQDTFPEVGSAQEVASQLKSAGADVASDVAKSATGATADVGADIAGTAVEAGADVAEGALGAATAATSAIPGVAEVLGLATAVAGFVGSFASGAQEESAEKSNPLTKTSFSQFNVVPTLSSMASQPSTPGVF